MIAMKSYNMMLLKIELKITRLMEKDTACYAVLNIVWSNQVQNLRMIRSRLLKLDLIMSQYPKYTQNRRMNLNPKCILILFMNQLSLGYQMCQSR